MKYFVIFLLLFFCGLFVNSDASRQVIGSSSVRTSVNSKQTRQNQRTTTHKPTIDNEYDDNYDHYPHGVLITEPQRPVPFDTSIRIGGGGVGGGGGRSSGIDDIYGARKYGERHGDFDDDWKPWDRFDTRSDMKHQHGIRPNQPPFIMSPESELMHMPNRGHMADDGNEDDHQAEQPCTLGCLNSEFLCTQSCMCIPKHQRCDKEINCESFGEDELDCDISNIEIIRNIKQECEASNQHVLCPKTFVCISKQWLCDGDNDCLDMSDEALCGGTRVNCTEDQFQCANGLCIQQQWVCDGDNDCVDFSDEQNCNLTCNIDEYQCADKTCISTSFRCDGEPDCPGDASDEQNCPEDELICPEGEFRCRGAVISSSSPGTRCILNRFRCDNENDCGDWSDEEGCQNVKSAICSSNEFKCGDGTTCIPIEWKCDMEQDCDGGEDEKCSPAEIEKSTKRTCAEDEFKCKDGRCILQTWLCDGIMDCKRYDDEINCPVQCDIGQFACPAYKNMTNARICVNQKHVCDGQNDCLKGEDEKNCPKEKKCSSNSKCEQLCIVTNDGQEACACRVGFTLHENKRNCTDIDECQYTVDPVCSQKCHNTIGSFQCGCTNGYILRPDLRTCKALGGAVKLIMANRVDIRQVSLSNNRYTSIVKGLHNAIALDFHYKKNLLFWSDVSTDVIKMSYLNGTGVQSIIKWGLESPGGIAVDWIHDLVFWTDSGTRRIEVTTFDGIFRAVVIANDLAKPRAIVVHPGEASIFWSDWGNGINTSTGPKPRIEKSFSDGSYRRTIISDGIFWPNGLTIDYSGGRIYWADAKHHVIENANFDGSDRKKILSNHLPHPFALTLFEDYLYWTDWNTKSISTVSKITGRGFRNVHIDLHFPMDIHAYHSSRQPNFLNRCIVDSRGQRGSCSHLCLPNKTSRRCVCPIGLTLKDDQKTCTEVPDKLLIISRKKDIRIRQLLSKNNLNEYDMVMPIDRLKSTIAIDWCHETDSVYYTDVGRSSISRAQLNGENQKQIIRSNLISPAGLAYDWVTKKIYWTDMGTNRIEVATTDGRLRTMLIWQGLDKPRDIVVNPIESMMFWCDWGKNPQIETAWMDGSNRKTLVSKHLQWPNGLAVDYAGNRLYFVDSGTKTMETVNFDGSGRQIILDEGLEHPFGIDVYDQKVFWTDFKTLNVESADKTTGHNRQVLIANLTDLMDVRVFHRDRKTVSNFCSISNGDCSHMCLLSPQLGYKCACPIGVKLSQDGKTCKDGPTDFIIFARRTDIRQISLDIDYFVDSVLPLPPMTSAMTVDVDVVTGDIYWSDTADDSIMKSTSDGIYFNKVIGDSIGSVDSLVVDSIGRKIYFTDSTRLSIEVCELNGSNRAALIWTDIEAPRGIAIIYSKGLLFWTDWMKSKIERAHMDGDKRTKIVDNDLGWPNSLAIFEEKLYWTDAKLKRIESCNYDGLQRRIVIKDLEHPYGLALTKQHIYWSDWKTNALHMLDRQNTTGPQIVRDNLEGLMDVKVIKKEEKRMENVCGHNNGNCSHLCLRNPKGFSCQCPTGTKLKSQTECSTLPENYLIFAMRSGIGRISLDTEDMFDVVLPIENVHGAVVVDYHYNHSKIYYADVNTDIIKSVDLNDMKSTKDIITTGLKTTNGLAVDWVANNLYWSDSASAIIEVARLDGSSRKTIINENLIDPRSLAIFPQRGLLFFSDWGKPQRIETAWMDGSNRKTIVNTNLGFPTGLCIDYTTRPQLYWADALEDRIEVSGLDGRDRKQIVEHTTHPFGVAVFESNIYWTNWYNKSIWKSDKRGRHKAQEVRSGLNGALDIRSVSKSRQPNQWSPCMIENGGCSHLCLYKYATYKCECPDKVDSSCTPDEHLVSLRPSFTPDYGDEFHHDDEDDKHPDDNSAIARIVIIATAILGVLLIIVLCAILYLVLNNNSNSNKKKETRTPRSSSESVLTFSNPNYNVAECDIPTEPKAKVWKRMKYDKVQERVWEERCLGEQSATVTLMPSGHTSNSSISRSPLSTIG